MHNLVNIRKEIDELWLNKVKSDAPYVAEWSTGYRHKKHFMMAKDHSVAAVSLDLLRDMALRTQSDQ